MQNNKQIILNIWERSGIVKFLEIEAALECEDPLTTIEIQLE